METTASHRGQAPAASGSRFKDREVVLSSSTGNSERLEL